MNASTLRPAVSAAAAGLFVFVVGCGSSHRPVPVTGSITVDGTPLHHGVVNFVLPAGKAAVGGAEVKDGKFTASVPPGAYKVTVMGTRPIPGKVTKSEMGEEPAVESAVPAKYTTDTPLTAEVKSDGAELKFALEGIKPAEKKVKR